MIKFDATATEIYDVISDVFGLEKNFFQLNQKQRELIEELAEKLSYPHSDYAQMEQRVKNLQENMILLNDIHSASLKEVRKSLKKVRRLIDKNIDDCKRRRLT